MLSRAPSPLIHLLVSLGLCVTGLFASAGAAAAQDTDGDGLLDGFEIANGFDPLDPDEDMNGKVDGQDDTDTDGLGNAAEAAAGTDPNDGDSDDDGLLDGAELGQGNFGSLQVISALTDGARSVFAADVDGDGDQDVLSASSNDDKIAWYENTDGAGSFGAQQVISTLAEDAHSVFAADLDGDGDQDVLSASRRDDKTAWYENTDGAGSFGAQQVISTGANGVVSVFAADLDGDGDQDVLTASENDNKIAWYENADGAGSFGAQQQLSTTSEGARSVFAADLDGDGDQDVLSASFEDDEIAWYENTDGAGSFGAQQFITTLANGAQSVFAADLDGDGDQDVLSASGNDDAVAWYENTDGAGSFGAQQVISTLGDGAISVFAADLDGDGDQDVLAASGWDDEIAWYENVDGAGSFGVQQIIDVPADGVFSVIAADLDGDGDREVLSATHFDNEIGWYENPSLADPLDPDSDDDGLLDGFEVSYGFDPLMAGEEILDPDLDGLSNLAEQAAGSDPFDPDSDDDGLLDGFEIANGFDPLLGGEENLDPDLDGLTNLAEQAAGTSPLLADTDMDGSDDDEELAAGTDPVDPDSDDDGLLDGFEIANGFDPLLGGEENLDPDLDGLTNLAEQAAGTSPLLADTDMDGSDDDEELAAGTDPVDPDSDDDGLLDGFEIANGFDPLLGGEENLDPDLDGLTNLAEQAAGTSPLLADTDMDGSDDDEELAAGTDPLDSDSDDDGLLDGFEIANGFDPLLGGEENLDPDLDGLTNLAEQAAGTSPLLADTDMDGSDDDEELAAGTDPVDPDSDDDGLLDGFEIANGFDPLLGGEENLDPDLDGLTNLAEQAAGTSPLLADTDMDGSDDDEELAAGTDPVDPDSDDDGLLDGFEIANGFDPLLGGEENLDPDLDGLTNLAEQAAGTSPLLADTDMDGSDDDEELAAGTDPLDSDSDDDGLLDGFEIANGFDPLLGGEENLDPDLDGLTNLAEQAAGTSPLLADTDMDGSDDDEELAAGTDPLDSDSDDDGLLDGFELSYGFDPLLGGEENLDPDLDGLTNLAEQAAGTSPLLADTDMDGSDDDEELAAGTDPVDPDSDDDGLLDGFEIANGFDPLLGGEENLDPDLDGLTNLAEQAAGTSPLLADTDMDGSDDDEELAAGTDPLDSDSDDDGLLDGFELSYGFDPLLGGEENLDPDLDGLTNLAEQAAGTSPLLADTDMDGSDDDEELAAGTDPVDEWSFPVVLPLVTVTSLPNADDVTGFGGVSYGYPIGSLEVTKRDYVAFLNAVADDDPNGLFNTSVDPLYGITRTGTAGSHHYDVVLGLENQPANFVSLYDAMRFVNWLANGQPTGGQGLSTTEDGAYTITPAGITANDIVLNPGASFSLPTEDEWYKAAYYEPTMQTYYESPAGTIATIVCATPSATPDTANCGSVVVSPTDAGAYSGTASPNATFDQGGNVWEWTDEIDGSNRRIRGGAFDSDVADLEASGSGLSVSPSDESADLGLRVVPEPGMGSGLVISIAGLGLLSRRSRKKEIDQEGAESICGPSCASTRNCGPTPGYALETDRGR